MLKIQIARRSKAIVFHCSGRIDKGEGLTHLSEAVLRELGGRPVILNLAGVSAIDAAGLGLLVFLHSRASGRGCELKLCAPSRPVENVIALTGLDSVLAICSPEEIAGPSCPFLDPAEQPEAADCAFNNG